MGDHARYGMSNAMDLDLNREPLDPANDSASGLGSMQDHEVQSARAGIEGRIRQLEAVYARSRWRQSGEPLRNALVDMVDDVCNEGREFVGRTKGVKRDSSHLVAKALELDMGVTKVVGDGVGFFDCNICLGMARDPVLTCCGHLFCWVCFYRLPYEYSTARECPVCKGEVTDSSITPIYGSTESTCVPQPNSGAEVPPRPKANRVESMRQKRVNRRVSQIPVADALRRFRIGIGGATEQHIPPSMPDTVLVGSGARRHRSRLASRALTEADAPLNSIPRTFSSREFSTGTVDMAVDEANQHPSLGFVFDNPGLDVFVPVEMSVNESQPPSSSRRRNRQPSRRRPRPHG